MRLSFVIKQPFKLNYQTRNAKLALSTLNSSPLSRGDEIKVKISKFGPLGASVSINNDINKIGLILQREISLFRKRRGGEDVLVGEELDAFVENICDNGRIDVSLRPVGYSRILTLKQTILEALEGSPSGSIPVGDKSDPKDIGSYFYGVSKSDFKTAVGALFKEGLVNPGETSTSLMSEGDKMKYQNNDLLPNKSNTPTQSNGVRVMKPPRLPSDRFIDHTIFIGNLPFNINDEIISKAFKSVLISNGVDSTFKIRLTKDISTGAPKGYGYVDFESEDMVELALIKLKGLDIGGRKLRVDYADPSRKKKTNINGLDDNSSVRTSSAAGWRDFRTSKASVDFDSQSDDDDGSGLIDNEWDGGSTSNKPVSNWRSTLVSSTSASPSERNTDTRVTGASRGVGRGGRLGVDQAENRFGDEKRPQRFGTEEQSGRYSRGEDRSGRASNSGWDGQARASFGRGEDSRGRPVEATLFLANLAYEATASNLRDEIERVVGKDSIRSIRVATDRDTGEPRGFAFVDFALKEDADKVYSDLQGALFMGRRLRIDDATKK